VGPRSIPAKYGGFETFAEPSIKLDVNSLGGYAEKSFHKKLFIPWYGIEKPK